MEIKSPKTVKKVQSLTGKMAALNRFVSRALDKYLPFFKVLKKAFQWTNECEEVLTKLKDYLTQPSLLRPSVTREKVHLYLAVSNTTVSSALIREDQVHASYLCQGSGPCRFTMFPCHPQIIVSLTCF